MFDAQKHKKINIKLVKGLINVNIVEKNMHQKVDIIHIKSNIIHKEYAKEKSK